MYKKILFLFPFLLIVSAAFGNNLFIKNPEISPDGKHILFQYNGDIWYSNINDKKAYPVTVHPAYESEPVWSDDGKTIFFSSEREGYMNLFKMDFPGGTPEQINNNNAYERAVSVHGDTLLIYSYLYPDKYRQIFTLNWRTGSRIIQNSFDEGWEGSFSPNGKKIAYIRGTRNKYRRNYRGSGNRDIWIKNVDSKFGEHRLTSYNGNDDSPVWSENGDEIYFISDRDGTKNIWKTHIGTGRFKQITFFTNGDIWSLSKTEKDSLLVFDYNNSIWFYDIKEEIPYKYDFLLSGGDRHFSDKEIIKIDEKISQFEETLDGKNLILSAYGEIYKKPKNYKGVQNLTQNNSRDYDFYISPDSIHMSFVSIRDSFKNIYLMNLKTEELKQITASEDYIELFGFNKKGDEIIYRSGIDFMIYNIKTNDSRLFLQDPKIKYLYWLNNEWIIMLYSKDDDSDDFYLCNINDKKLHQITFSYDWKYYRGVTGDNKILYLQKGILREISLTKPVPKFKEDVETDDEDKKKEKKNQKKDIEIDLDYIRNRTDIFLQMNGYIYDAEISEDGKQVLIALRREYEDLYEIWLTDIYKKEKKKIIDFKADDIEWSLKNDKFYALSKGKLYEIDLKGKKEQISFSDEFIISKKELYYELFRESWLVMKNRFYDPNMHNTDWDEIFEKYLKYVRNVKMREDLEEIIDMMLGELRASHIGYTAEDDFKREDSKSNGYLGLIYDTEYSGEGYRVKDIITGGPFDIYGSKLKKGDYILEVNGEKLTGEKSINELLWRRIGRKTKILYGSGIDFRNTDTIFVKPVSRGRMYSLVYDYKVLKRKSLVDSLSNGKIAYLHIRSMDRESLKRFRDEFLSETKKKQGLILDIRDNGGGNIHDEVLTYLIKEPFALSKDRFHREYTVEPPTAFTGETVLLINQWCFSDAEIFPQIFREQKLGTIIGVPTYGSVIGTRSYYLMDGSSIRMPLTGWYSLDEENMEFQGVEPDIYIENRPEDMANDYDRQLIKAVEYLLEDF